MESLVFEHVRYNLQLTLSLTYLRTPAGGIVPLRALFLVFFLNSSLNIAQICLTVCLVNYVSPRRVGRHIVFPRASVCLSVCLSARTVVYIGGYKFGQLDTEVFILCPNEVYSVDLIF